MADLNDYCSGAGEESGRGRCVWCSGGAKKNLDWRLEMGDWPKRGLGDASGLFLCLATINSFSCFGFGAKQRTRG